MVDARKTANRIDSEREKQWLISMTTCLAPHG